MPVYETNFNAFLAEELETRMPGWNVRAQQDASASGGTRKHPDAVAAAPSGTLITIEAKFAAPVSNLSTLEEQTGAHLGRKIRGRTPVASVSVVYPAKFKKTRSPLRKVLAAEKELRFAVWTEGAEEGGVFRFPTSGYLTGGLNRLADILEISAESDRRTAELTEEFSAAVSSAAQILDGKHPAMAEVVMQEPGEQTDQMTSSLILNALIFHHQVSGHHPGIPRPSSERGGIRQRLLKEWKMILEINYWPIFKIASDLLTAIGDGKTAEVFLEGLQDTAVRMASEDAHVTQNLAGHVFGTLLADRKFLASFYTLPPAAALLAELAVGRLNVDWGNTEAVGNLRVADFACGSGALLSAAYRSIRQRVRRQGINDETIHRRMLEEVFIGCDIMPAGVHITAATLSSVHPRIDYTKTETHVMPIGPYKGDVDGVRTGSLELLAAEDTGTLFGDGSEMVAAKEKPGGELKVKHNSCDLIIMNPPYTAPTNHAKEERKTAALPQFAAFGMDKTMQKKIGKKVKGMIRKLGVYASDGKAGLATDFFDLAHRKLKPGGVLAFVIPATVTVGASYQKLRDILASEYENITIITCSSGKDEHRRFSSDTDKGECLIVATRRLEGAVKKENELWRWVSLDRNPKTVAEAAAIAEEVSYSSDVEGEATEGKAGDSRWGFSFVGDRNAPPTAVRSTETLGAMLALTDPSQPRLVLPRSNQVTELPLAPLDEMGTRGPLHRYLMRNAVTGKDGPFDFHPHTGGKTDFPGLWNHHAGNSADSRETRLVVEPDVYGKAVKGREQVAADRWKTATRLHFTLDFRLTSQPLAACLTPEKALGGRAWPSFTLHTEGGEAVERMDWVYPVLLWANTTLGLMSFYTLGNRIDPGRSSVSVSRLPDLLVLDPRALTPAQIKEAKTIFGEFEERQFLPASKAAEDETRCDLDEAVLTRLLGLGDEVLERVEVIRDQWCREPHLTGGG